ncbi:alpha/beta hydrolase [Microterricola pindariensis]|uniref:Peptidase n=1 Tax=Microterricola pindariensis TaxID=478010 RepID=A0ABX5AWY3_9MICO|nr:alpha/beta hydrolase [Microterricola pindariensis]PPL19402.1 peptidase [Microterricola pindariensis]
MTTATGPTPTTTPRRRARRLGAALAGVLAVTLALTGCVTAFLPEPPPATSTPTGEDVDASLAPFYGQTVQWSNCGGGMQCADVNAPLDWAEPASGSIKLAIVRQNASGDKIGSLFVNPGGPGASGFDFVKDSVNYATDQRLQERFDVVGFDPRGVGRSTAVTCYDAAGMDAYLYDVSTTKRGTDAWIAEMTTSARDFGEACADETGPLLEHVDTESAARDLDLLRAVLGDSELYYLGYSYGTFLGAVYAELFPGKVGRLVLDGALDPAASNFEVTKVQAVGFENALRAYLKDCLSATSCPFEGTVDQGMATIGALLQSVDASPIRAEDGRELGSNALLTAIIYPLYDANAWGMLSDMLESVMHGDAQLAFQFADGYNGRNPDGSYSDNSTEAFMAINCMDYSYNADPASMREQAAEIAAAAPVIGAYMSYGDIGCANWPYAFQGERGPINAEGAPPILVIGTTNDPATPYVWAEALADQLDSGVLVTYQGEGHTAYNKSNSCIANTVDDYLIAGTVPAADPRC